MRIRGAIAAIGLAIATTSPVLAQPAPNSAAAIRAIEAGAYKVDPDHTQVVWSVDHMGFSRLQGMVGGMSGTLQLDPARPAAAVLTIEIPLSGLTVTSPGFSQHLRTPDLFDTSKFPTARFVSTSVVVRGQQATVTGDLTLRGVTKPIVLNARFYGAGVNPMSKAQTVGFSATGELKRSDFDLGYGVPAVSDKVMLEVNAAFEKVES